MASPARPNAVQLVVKLSKYCNLRCSYCYEFKYLSEKRRMSLLQIGTMFQHMAEYAYKHEIEQLDFIWHGGEPFMIPVDYYEEIADLQKKILGDVACVTNGVQSNMTIMTNRHIKMLKDKTLFDYMGISFDVYGDQRVDIKGKLRTNTVINNMQKLVDNDIYVGAIAVLARNTLDHAIKIYDFYDKLSMSMRFLPFYMSSFEDQVSEHALTYNEIVGTLNQLFDRWAQSESATPLEPIGEYMDYAIAHIAGVTPGTYNKHTEELVYLVDIDGSIWGISEPYKAGYQYGNIFKQSFEEILDSAGREKTTIEAEARIAHYCKDCRFQDSCTGSFVADATTEQQNMLSDHGCLLRPVIEHIVTRLMESGFPQEIMKTGIVRTNNTTLQVPL